MDRYSASKRAGVGQGAVTRFAWLLVLLQGGLSPLLCEATPIVLPTPLPTLGPSGAPSPQPTLEPTAAPSLQPTLQPTAAPTMTPKPTTPPTGGPTASPTMVPTNLPTFAPSLAPSLAPSAAPSSAPSSAPSLSPSRVPTLPPSLFPTPLPTMAPTAKPTLSPTAKPTLSPSLEPTAAPSLEPSPMPTYQPTLQPTALPTLRPTPLPTATPLPTFVPTLGPTAQPTLSPSLEPTVLPTLAPSPQPTLEPTAAPSLQPTLQPTAAPTDTPKPTTPPTLGPTASPTRVPTAQPSQVPTALPTATPSLAPTSAPSLAPTLAPSVLPTMAPSGLPSSAPTLQPTALPTLRPTPLPTATPLPTPQPTLRPTLVPTMSPAPTYGPTPQPSLQPSPAPSLLPTQAPTAAPTYAPTLLPTAAPSSAPTLQPSPAPTISPAPTPFPSSLPSGAPTMEPTAAPSSQPTLLPTYAPSLGPSNVPTLAPTGAPTLLPSLEPSASPTYAPSALPTFAPSMAPSAAPTATPVPTLSTFRLGRGNCTVDSAGTVLLSPNYPKNYSNNEFCVVYLNVGGALRSDYFRTAPPDSLMLWRTGEEYEDMSYSYSYSYGEGYGLIEEYRGTNDTDFIQVYPEDMLIFQSDAANVSRGFSLRVVAFPTAVPTLLPTAGPSLVPTQPSPVPSSLPTLGDYCVDYTVRMYDSFGDGWTGVTLYVGGHTFTLDDGSQGTESACLYIGRTFEPYTCDGAYSSEVSWEIFDQNGYSVANESTGFAGTCNVFENNVFTITVPSPTMSPAPTTSLAPTKMPTTRVKITDSTSLRTAVRHWCNDSASAELKYGPISIWDTSGVTDMSFLFAPLPAFRESTDSDYDDDDDVGGGGGGSDPKRGYCSSASTFDEDLSRWNVSSVTDLTGAFYKCYRFSGGGLGNWSVTSKCTSLERMFHGAQSFEAADLSRWDTSSVNTTYAMFRRATNFNGIVDAWDLRSLKDCSYMFDEAEFFSGDLSSWNVKNVTTMEGMFAGAVSFNGELSQWQTQRVTTFEYMFQGASSFNQDISGWPTSRVRVFSYMFHKASSFNQDVSNWETSSAVVMKAMFSLATTFTHSLCWRLSSAVDTDKMFHGSGDGGSVTGIATCSPSPLPTALPTTSCSAGSVWIDATQTCEACVPGKYSDADDPRTSGTSSCLICGAGTYAQEHGASSCTNCGKGTSLSDNGRYAAFHTSPQNCTSCEEGKYNDNEGPDEATGASSCTPCSAGKNASSQGATSCAACVPGRYQSATGQGRCLPCEAGYYSLSGKSECSACVSGRYSRAGATNCTFCSKGTFSGPRAPSCTDCSNGTYWATTGGTACSGCDAGKFQSRQGMPSCERCAGGRYSAKSATVECTPCTAGKTSSEGATSCQDCDTGRWSYDEASNCTICDVGYFLEDVERKQRTGSSEYRTPGPKQLLPCIACEAEGVQCSAVGAQLSTLKLRDGYFRIAAHSHRGVRGVRECPMKKACKGGGNFSRSGNSYCRRGYRGPLCAVCERKYYRDTTNDLCVECAETSMSVELMALAAAAFIVMVVATTLAVRKMASLGKEQRSTAESAAKSTAEIAAADRRKSSLAENGGGGAPQGDNGYMMAKESLEKVETLLDAADDATGLFDKIKTKLKIMVTFSQLVTSMGFNLGVNFPSSFLKLTSVLKFANLDFIQMVPLDCLHETTYYSRLLVTTLTPLLIAIMLLGLDAHFGMGKCARLFCVDTCQRGPLKTDPADLPPLTKKGRQKTPSDDDDDDEEAANKGERKGDDGKDDDDNDSADATLETPVYTNTAFLTAFLVGAYLVLPTSSSVILQMYKCTNFDDVDESYMAADYRIQCGTEARTPWLVYTGCMMLIYPLGIPSLFAVMLWSARRELCPHAFVRTDEEDHDDFYKKVPRGFWYIAFKNSLWEAKENENSYAKGHQLSFLASAYQPHAFMFEVVECFRRLMLSSLLILVPEDNATQEILAVFICLFSIKIYSYYEPFIEIRDDMLSECTQWQLFFVLFAALMIRVDASSSDTETQGYLLVACTAVGFVLMKVLVFYDIKEELEEMLEAEETIVSTIKNAIRRSFAPCCPLPPPEEAENEGEGEGEDEYGVMDGGRGSIGGSNPMLDTELRNSPDRFGRPEAVVMVDADRFRALHLELARVEVEKEQEVDALRRQLEAAERRLEDYARRNETLANFEQRNRELFAENQKTGRQLQKVEAELVEMQRQREAADEHKQELEKVQAKAQRKKERKRVKRRQRGGEGEGEEGGGGVLNPMSPTSPMSGTDTEDEAGRELEF